MPQRRPASVQSGQELGDHVEYSPGTVCRFGQGAAGCVAFEIDVTNGRFDPTGQQSLGAPEGQFFEESLPEPRGEKSEEPKKPFAFSYLSIHVYYFQTGFTTRRCFLPRLNTFCNFVLRLTTCRYLVLPFVNTCFTTFHYF